MKWNALCLAVFVFTLSPTECQAEKLQDAIDKAGKEAIGYENGRLIRDKEGKISGVGREGDLKGIEYNPCNSATPPSWCPKK